MNNTPIIDIRDVSFSYDVQPVLQQVSLQVERGEFLGIIGPNGGGKSTLLKIILGLLEPQQGTVQVLGRSPLAARQAIGYVPQFARFPRQFPISVEDTVLMGRLGHARGWGRYSKQDRAVVERVMRETDTLAFRKRAIESLSGGQLQRVLVARALASEPQLLLLDEPTASVDMRAEKDIFELFRELNKRMTIVVISHDVGFVSEYVNRVACLNRTLVCHATQAITPDVLQQMYGPHVHLVRHDTHAV